MNFFSYGKKVFSCGHWKLIFLHRISLQIPFKLPESFVSWKRRRSLSGISATQEGEKVAGHCRENVGMVKFSCSEGPRASIRAVVQGRQSCRKRSIGYNQLNSLARILSSQRACKTTDVSLAKDGTGDWDICNEDLSSILSMHVPVTEIFSLSCNIIIL